MPELPEIFNIYRKDIEEEMKSIISVSNLPLYDMLKYHMGWMNETGKPGDFNKGKFLRATLCILAFISTMNKMNEKSIKKNHLKVLPAAAAIELIHNFSLIHDDIQDNDIQRRHRPTLWYLWGKPQAINAGTTMKVLANLAVFRLKKYNVSCEKQLQIFKILNESCLEMLEGQYLDISYENKPEISIEEYMQMIESKTVSLIKGAILIGAVLNLDKKGLSSFEDFANHLGIAFQIRDDILGIWGSQEKTGKPIGGDIRKKKKSLPIVYALNNSPLKIKKELMRIYSFKKISETNSSKVIKLLDEVKAKEYCENKCDYFYNLAISKINNLPLSKEYYKSYYEICDFLLTRDF